MALGTGYKRREKQFQTRLERGRKAIVAWYTKMGIPVPKHYLTTTQQTKGK